MKSIEKIIELIDKGDPVPILAEDSLVEKLNELLRHDLIDIVNDKIILTPKGQEARNGGLDRVVAYLQNEEELKEFSLETQKKESKVYKWCLGLCFSFLIFFIIAFLTDCPIIF